jgi:hypothetical protein
MLFEQKEFSKQGEYARKVKMFDLTMQNISDMITENIL